MSRLLSTPLFALFTAATMPAAADSALEHWLAAEPLWILQSPAAGADPVYLWLDHQEHRVLLAGCAQPGCTAALQFGPEDLQLQDGAGKIFSFEIENAKLPVLRAKVDGTRLMPSRLVSTGHEPRH